MEGRRKIIHDTIDQLNKRSQVEKTCPSHTQACPFTYPLIGINVGCSHTEEGPSNSLITPDVPYIDELCSRELESDFDITAPVLETPPELTDDVTEIICEPDVPYIDELCSRELESDFDITAPVLETPPELTDDVTVITCEPDIPYIDELCPRELESDFDSTAPSDFILKKNAFKCEHCQKVFTRQDNYKRHIQLYHKEIPILLECKKCGRRFSNKGSLKEHKKIVHNCPEYPCSQCGKSLSSASYRDYHMLKSCPSLRKQILIGNTGDKPAAMDLDVDTDEAGAQTQPAVVEPGTSTAPTEQPSNLGKSYHACTRCGLTYYRKGNLTRHLNYECGVYPQFSCPQCPYKAYRRNELKKHMLKWHGSENIH